MKKVISAFIIFFLLISCTNKIYNSSSWQSKKVTVDGNIPEWSNPLRFYDQETGLSYCISNDKFNIYFCCSVSDEFLQTKILRSGIELGIDTLGKKNFTVGIRYPTGNSSVTEMRPNVDPQAITDPKTRSDRSAYKLKLLAEAREIQLIGFKPNLGKYISLTPQNSSGISAAINFDNKGFLNYEAVIPFSTFYKNQLIPSDSDKVFDYQIKINQVNRSNNGGNGSGNRGGGMNGGGMRGGGMRGGGMGGGGMRGGGMRGGGMRGGEMGNSEMSGESGRNNYQRNANASGTTKTTIKLKLAYK